VSELSVFLEDDSTNLREIFFRVLEETLDHCNKCNSPLRDSGTLWPMKSPSLLIKLFEPQDSRKELFTLLHFFL